MFSFVAAFLLFQLPLVLAAFSALYYLLVVLAAIRFRWEMEPAGSFAPPVSILKPVRGIEQSFYPALASHFQQDYPQFEIIFGLSDEQDPARWTIAQLQRDFPHVPVKVITVPDLSAANPKMNKLQRMLEVASHEVVVINDADIRVERNYLRRVVRPLADERVGLVTCLYRGVPIARFWSVLEALSISGDFAGQVLLARQLEGVRFGLGATLVTRKRQIAEIGGLAPWADYLADDYIIGNKIAAAGYRIHLSHTVVKTMLSSRTLTETFHQQLRWAQTIRFSSPRGYPGLVLTFGVPLALIAMAYNPASGLALSIIGLTLATRWLAAWASGVLICQDRIVRNFFWLLPLRDILAFAVWLASFAGHEVVWRQERFRIEPDGKIRPV
ncbi:MAG: bacteriohopanetetrol glucosamine biosynthesis glycosyltransferase HpnI [Acidobacteria bacterium]|nr:bacteriohopanetetrol glucosamine biosynthesis glycosyltransferase HpnI [Acidobacteriota bacterium]